jgi:predicted RNA-binding protein with RPS1 domain
VLVVGQIVEGVVTSVKHHGAYLSCGSDELGPDSGTSSPEELESVYGIGQRVVVKVVKHAEGTLYRACHPAAQPPDAPPELYEHSSR